MGIFFFFFFGSLAVGLMRTGVRIGPIVACGIAFRTTQTFFGARPYIKNQNWSKPDSIHDSTFQLPYLTLEDLDMTQSFSLLFFFLLSFFILY